MPCAVEVEPRVLERRRSMEGNRSARARCGRLSLEAIGLYKSNQGAQTVVRLCVFVNPTNLGHFWPTAWEMRICAVVPTVSARI
jgi:hypothetical protein